MRPKGTQGKSKHFSAPGDVGTEGDALILGGKSLEAGFVVDVANEVKAVHGHYFGRRTSTQLTSIFLMPNQKLPPNSFH